MSGEEAEPTNVRAFACTMRTTHEIIRYVNTAPPRLAPIFRSDTQLQILGATYLEPERHFMSLPGYTGSIDVAPHRARWQHAQCVSRLA